MANLKLTSESSSMSINVIKRERPASMDHADGNWLTSTVIIKKEDLGYQYHISLRTDELKFNLNELTKFLSGKGSTFDFVTLDNDFRFTITRTGSDKFSIKGRVESGENFTDFSLTIPLQEVTNFQQGIKDILQEFPIIGEHN